MKKAEEEDCLIVRLHECREELLTVVAQMSGEELRRLLEFITRMEGNPETEEGT